MSNIAGGAVLSALGLLMVLVCVLVSVIELEMEEADSLRRPNSNGDFPLTTLGGAAQEADSTNQSTRIFLNNQ